MKKGFTLVELLAVIVILAVIALIATPTILSMIEESKEGAFLDSSLHALDAASNYFAFSEEENMVSISELELSHKDTLEGYIENNSGELNAVISNDGFCFVGTQEDYTLYKNSCFKEDIATGIYLPNKDYKEYENASKKIQYAGSEWYVLSDNGESVTLLKYKALENVDEYAAYLGLNKSLVFDTGKSAGKAISPCLLEKSDKYCFWESSTSYKDYDWTNSTSRAILYKYLEKNNILNKAKEEGILLEQQFQISDTIEKKDYIRIPSLDDLGVSEKECGKTACATDLAFWFIDQYPIDRTWNENKLIFWAGPGIYTHWVPESKFALRPIIVVKKLS